MSEGPVTRPGVRLCGRIGTGRGVGRRLGFPTINLETRDPLPESGVYAGEVLLGERRFPAAIHVGERPTFGAGAASVEAYLIGFTGEAYGCEAAITLASRIRDVEKFMSLDDLRRRISRDVDEVRRLLGAHDCSSD